MEREKNHDCEHCELKEACKEWNEVFKTDTCFGEMEQRDENDRHVCI